MHGGAPGSGAPIGNKNALKHGHYTAEAIEMRRFLRKLVRAAREDAARIIAAARAPFSTVPFTEQAR